LKNQKKEVKREVKKAIEENKVENEEEIDVDDLLDEKVLKIRRRKKKGGIEQKDPESVEESLEEAHGTIDNLEIDLEIKTNEVSRLRKQNQVYQAEIKKFLTINSQLTEDVRNLTSRCDLEEKAFNEFRSKANSDIERLEDELKTTKGVLNEELISKKTLLKESKKSKERNFISSR